jgi:hypothetical protein
MFFVKFEDGVADLIRVREQLQSELSVLIEDRR